MKALRLRPLSDGDVPQLKAWLCRAHVARWYEHPAAWLAEVQNRHGEFCWIHHYIAELDGRAVGFGQHYAYGDSGEAWHGETEIAGTYSIDYLIGERADLGKGLGKALVLALLNEIRRERGARRVIVQPDAENAASRGALLSAGFCYDAPNGVYLFNL